MNFKKTWDKSEGISTLFEGGNLNMLGLKMLKLSEGKEQWCQFPGMEAAVVILKEFLKVRRLRFMCPKA